jgi:hypothetical protein
MCNLWEAPSKIQFLGQNNHRVQVSYFNIREHCYKAPFAKRPRWINAAKAYSPIAFRNAVRRGWRVDLIHM